MIETLVEKLNTIPNSYFGFVAGITAYAKKKPERTKAIMDYLENNDHLTVSDIVKFVMLQPDFHEDMVPVKKTQMAS